MFSSENYGLLVSCCHGNGGSRYHEAGCSVRLADRRYRPVNLLHSHTSSNATPRQTTSGIGSWITRCILTPWLLASMAQCAGSGGETCERNVINKRRLSDNKARYESQKR